MRLQMMQQVYAWRAMVQMFFSVGNYGRDISGAALRQ